MPTVLRVLALPALVVLGVMPALAAQDASRAEADRMSRKVQAIVGRALLPPKDPTPMRTTFTDRELNAYLTHYSDEALPPGVKQAQVLLLDQQRVQTRAIVDLDAVRTSQPRGWLDPMAYVKGSLEVVMLGTFSAANGKGVYHFESGTVGGVAIPRAVMQELLSYYTRSPETPNGIGLDQPFDLPAAIREVQVRRGAATVVQ